MNGNKSIVLTGAAGFIGSNLLRRLLKESFDIHILLKKTTSLWRIKDIIKNATCHSVDLTNKKMISLLLSKIKPFAVYHLATYGSYPQQTDISKMIDTNIHGTYNLLVACMEIPYHLFVTVGTSSEYGWKTRPMKETDSLDPVSYYGATKAAATLLCQTFARANHKPIIIVRPFSVYGPYEKKSRFIPTAITALVSKTPIRLTKSTVRRDFIYIDDVTDALLRLLKVKKNINSKVFNVGTGKESSNDEVVKMLFSVTKKRTRVIKGGYAERLWDTKHWASDMSHTKRVLSWKPTFSLAQGLIASYQWHMKYYGINEKKKNNE